MDNKTYTEEELKEFERIKNKESQIQDEYEKKILDNDRQDKILLEIRKDMGEELYQKIYYG